MAQDGSQVRQVTLNVDVGYAKSVLGILKVIQFFFLMITWACMTDCCSGRYRPETLFGGRYGGRYDFYLFVTIVGWLCITFIYVWFLLMLKEKVILPAAISDGMILVICFEMFWTLLLLISSSLVADVAKHYSALTKYGGTDLLEKIYGAMVAAVIFGFFTMVLLIVDIVFLIIKIVKSRQAVATTPNATA